MAAAINARSQYLRYNRYFRRLTDAYTNVPAVRVSVELLLTLFTISFFVIFALRPTINTISDLVSQIRSQEEIKTKLEQKITNLARAQELWTREKAKVSLIEQAIGKTPEPDIYIKQVEKLAVSKGLSISFLKVEEVGLKGEVKNKEQNKPKKTKSTDFIDTAVSVTGSYGSLLSFLEGLENLRRTINVTSISFVSTKNPGQSQNTLVLTIASKVPYKK